MLSHFSRVQLFATPRTVARRAPLSVGFYRQEYWSGLPCPPPGDLPEPGIEPVSLTSPALAGGFFTTSASLEGLRGASRAYNAGNHKTGLVGLMEEQVWMGVSTPTKGLSEEASTDRDGRARGRKGSRE